MTVVQCSHQYKSVIDTLREEEELPYAMAPTFFDADTDLWHMESNKPLRQYGPCKCAGSGKLALLDR